MTDIVDTNSARTCAYADNPPMFHGFLCERDAGHYPTTPHAAFLDSHASPIYWNNSDRQTDEFGIALMNDLQQWPGAQPVSAVFVRADVEAKQKANDAILQQLAARGVGVAIGDLLTTYVALIVERLFGDMNDQRRLELENAYADAARGRLEATASAAMQEFIRQGVTPGGIHLPNGGQR